MSTRGIFHEIFSPDDIAVRPAFYVRVPHAYHLGGFEISPNAGLDVDFLGLEWVRTFNLVHDRDIIGYRMIEPEDLHVILGPNPSVKCMYEMYGKPVAYEEIKRHK